MPEKELWASVLAQAIEDYHKPRVIYSCGKVQRIIDSARQWFKSEESGIGSFLWICDMLGLDPSAARAVLAKATSTLEYEGPTLGPVLRGYRLRHGLTQVQLATRIGISHSHLSCIENGIRRKENLRPRVFNAITTFLTEAKDGAAFCLHQ